VTEVKKDIKNINEILDALELTLNTAGEVLADGKISLSDLPSALKLVNNYKVFMDAIEGALEVIEEAKDIDETEAIAIGLRVYKIISGVAAIVKEARK
jgi:hypothetical protein